VHINTKHQLMTIVMFVVVFLLYYYYALSVTAVILILSLLFCKAVSVQLSKKCNSGNKTRTVKMTAQATTTTQAIPKRAETEISGNNDSTGNTVEISPYQ
jgi:hypothetical protein